MAELRNKIADREQERLTAEDVDAAFDDFGNTWDLLSPHEQTQLIALLAARKRWHPTDRRIKYVTAASSVWP